MRDGLKWLDSDMHMAEPWNLWESYIEPEFRDRLEELTRVGPGYNPLTHGPTTNIREIRQTRVSMFDEYIAPDGTSIDPAGQLRAMDKEGIDAAVLFPTVGLQVPNNPVPGAGMAVRQAFNSWLGDFCSYDTTRLKMNAIVDTHDIDAALAEMRRAKTELGAVSVLPDPRGDGSTFDDPLYEPLWTEAERLNLAIDFHNGIPGQLEARYRNQPTHLFVHASSRPVGHMCTFMELLFGGVLERHPRLRFVFLECGASWVPYWLARLEGEGERFKELQPDFEKNVTMPPVEYWKRQCYCAVEVDEWSLPGVISTIGDDNLVVSSDFPHFDSEFPHAGDSFMALQNVSRESQRKILWDNCARLYGLD